MHNWLIQLLLKRPINRLGKYFYLENRQCSAKALEKWGQMTHTIEKYGDICNISGVTFVILPFINLSCVGTLAPTVKIIGDIPDFNVLNVPKMQPRHNPEQVLKNLHHLILCVFNGKHIIVIKDKIKIT